MWKKIEAYVSRLVVDPKYPSLYKRFNGRPFEWGRYEQVPTIYRLDKDGMRVARRAVEILGKTELHETD